MPPPDFVEAILSVFRRHEAVIQTEGRRKGLTSDEVLTELRNDLVGLGFDVERGKRKEEKILRPVFFGENGIPTIQYEIDAYSDAWECGLEVEAGRAWMGNAVYRDLINACVMGQVKYLVLAVPNAYQYRSSGRHTTSRDYDHSVALADALYGHSRFRLPYDLIVVGY